MQRKKQKEENKLVQNTTENADERAQKDNENAVEKSQDKALSLV